MRYTKLGRHRAKLLEYDGRRVRIDEEIAPMIQSMWKLGIKTSNSCQGACSFECDHKIKKHPVAKDGSQYFEKIKTKHCRDCIWLVFESTKDAELFYNCVAEYVKGYEPSMYMNINGFDRKKNARDVWILDCSARNNGVLGRWSKATRNGVRNTYQTWEEDRCETNNFIIEPQLTFPRKHLQYVEKRLKLAIENMK